MAERVSVLYKTEWNSSFQEFQARFQCIVSWLIVRSVAWFTAINSSDSLPLYVCKLSTEKLKHSLPGTKMSETIKFIKQRNSYRLICKFSPPSSCVISWPGFKKSSARSYWHILDLLWMGHCVLPSWTFVKCAIEYLTWVYVEWIEIKLICKLKRKFSNVFIYRFSYSCWAPHSIRDFASKH